MSDIESLKAAIAETNDALSQKVKILESNVKATACSIKDSVEQGATNVRNVANALSPVHQVKEHPYLVTGALLGLGVYLGSRSRRKHATKNPIINTTPAKDPAHQAVDPVHEIPHDEDHAEAITPSKIRAIAEPAVVGLFAAVAGEVIKRYFPKVESQATAVQSALIAEMTGRIVQELK